MKKLVDKFKALGDETRFRLFLLLSEKQICAKGLAEILSISESAVSQNLKILHNAGLIKGENIGPFVHYNVEKNALKELQKNIDELSKNVIDLTGQKKAFNIDSVDCTEVCKDEGKDCGCKQ